MTQTLESVVYKYKSGYFLEAFKGFWELSNDGNLDAKTYLGRMYLHGQGVPQNYDEAFKLFLDAKKHGNLDAHYYLGNMYFTGKGRQKDTESAMGYYGWLAERHDPRGQLYLGQAHHTGEGKERDLVLAHMYFNLSASTHKENPYRGKAKYYRAEVEGKLSERDLLIAQNSAQEEFKKQLEMSE